ncbi:MAG: DUF3822 family protein [Mucilaginibacter polytrichastri]|nr:DUF3822 family protein [Mucilaginibacter polytrichastri]
MADLSKPSYEQPAFVAQSGESWAITYPVQPNQDPVTGHSASLSEFLSTHHTSSYISLTERNFLFIPDAVYDESMEAEYRRLLAAGQGDAYYTASWPDADAVLVYAADRVPQRAGFTHVFPGSLAMHTALVNMYDDTGHNGFFILQPDEVFVFFYQRNRLVLYNRYSIENNDELAYFLLQAVRQSGMPADRPLRMLAEGYGAGRAYEHLRRFMPVEHVSTGRLPVYNGISLFEEINLYGLQLCASSAEG